MIESSRWSDMADFRGSRVSQRPLAAFLSRSGRPQNFFIVCIAFVAVSCGGGGSSSNSTTTTPASAPATAQAISVTVSPLITQVAPGGTQQFTAIVTGTANTAVTWSIGGVQGGTPSMGIISASGLYTAPTTIPVPSNVNIVAASVADPTKTGTGIADVHLHHDNQDLQATPIKLGTSGGNRSDTTTSAGKLFCCSGTLGSLVSRSGNFYILSDNHVLDKSDQGAIGDAISQPGLVDTECGQNPSTIVANMSQAAPLKTSNVDAAMAQIAANQVDTTGTILDLAGTGQPAPPSSTIATPTIGQPVAKSGEATGLTCASITAINAVVRVTYSTSCQGGSSFDVTFDNQVAMGDGTFSNNGDSGSLIVTSDTARPVALLYAGSSTTTIANPIQDVLSALKDPNSSEVPKMVGGADHAVSCPAGTQSQVVARRQTSTGPTLSRTEIVRATAAKDSHATELMQDPAVSGVGVGQSEDNPTESAVVVFLNQQPRVPIPAQIDGVRTKIVLGSEFRPQGQGQAGQTESVVAPVTESEVVRARSVKQQHAQDLMSNPAVLGVGVGASNDNAGQAAIVLFVEQGTSPAVPAEIDGVRTRVIATDRFRTSNWGRRTAKACSRR
jgi:hypothetical protein